jgi:hypothetical protein
LMSCWVHVIAWLRYGVHLSVHGCNVVVNSDWKMFHGMFSREVLHTCRVGNVCCCCMMLSVTLIGAWSERNIGCDVCVSNDVTKFGSLHKARSRTVGSTPGTDEKRVGLGPPCWCVMLSNCQSSATSDAKKLERDVPALLLCCCACDMSHDGSFALRSPITIVGMLWCGLMCDGVRCMKRVNVFQSRCDAVHDMYAGMSKNGCTSCGDEMCNNAIVEAVDESNVHDILWCCWHIIDLCMYMISPPCGCWCVCCMCMVLYDACCGMLFVCCIRGSIMTSIDGRWWCR